MSPFDLHRVYLQLTEDGGVRPKKASEDFWSEGVHEVGADRLMMAFRFDQDWDHWEMHPCGDEIALSLSGSCDFVLLDESDQAERRVLLSAGRAMVIPRGTWHRVEVTAPVHLLLVTAGEGTLHRPR